MPLLKVWLVICRLSEARVPYFYVVIHILSQLAQQFKGRGSLFSVASNRQKTPSLKYNDDITLLI
jgi:hypothetical protein